MNEPPAQSPGYRKVPFPEASANRPAPIIPDHEMIRPIGRGSYGEVWLARNAVGTWRAIKVLYRDRFKDERPYEREFGGIQKYEPISRTNEGLVDVLQIGRNDSGGYFYYVMELADDASLDPNHRQNGGIKGRESSEGSAGAVPLSASPPCSATSKPVSTSGLNPETYVAKTLAQEIRAQGRLPVGECIYLGLTLNMALGHLHRHGLIHRDVKPSNIIFVNQVPKLADIGLVTDLAEAESFVGTEGFFPPEGPNSRHADLFALGKVLYEASMGKDRQEFPEPFTGALGSDADSRALMELNEVLLKACSPVARERYQSAEEMNADLALLHSGKSVHEKHALERRLKFTRRLAGAVLGIMILGVVPYYWAIQEARAAKREASKSRQVALVLKDMVEAVGPGVARGRNTELLREILKLTDDRVREELKGEPAVQADLLDVIGQVYAELGELKLAEARLRQALGLRRGALDREDPAIGMTLQNLSVVLKDQGEWLEAESCAQESLRVFRNRLKPDAVEISLPLETLAGLLNQKGDLQRAIALQTEALTIARNGLGKHARVAFLMDNLGVLLRRNGQLKEAEAMHRDALRLTREVLGNDHPDVASELRNLANVLAAEGNFTEANSFQKEGLDLCRKLYGNDSRETALALNDLGSQLVAQMALDEAAAAFKEALTIFKQRQDGPNISTTLGNLGAVLYYKRDLAGAASTMAEAVDLCRKRFGNESLEVAGTLLNLAAVQERQGKLPEAESAAQECLAIREKVSPNGLEVIQARRRLARILMDAKQYARAEPLLVSSYDGLLKAEGTQPTQGKGDLGQTKADLVRLYEAWEKPEKVAEWREKNKQTEEQQTQSAISGK